MAPPDDKDREDREDDDDAKDEGSEEASDAVKGDGDAEGEAEGEADAEPDADAGGEADADADADAAGGAEPDGKRVGTAAPTEEDDPGAIKMLKNVDRAVGTVELGILVATMMMLILLGSYNALRDLTGAKTSLSLAEAFRYSVFAIAMMGAALAAQRSSMISMDIVGRLAKPKTRTIIRVITNLFAAFMTILLLMRSYDVTKAVRDDVPYDNIPPSKGVWILPIGAALIVFHLTLHAIIDTIYLAKGRLPPESGDIQVH